MKRESNGEKTNDRVILVSSAGYARLKEHYAGYPWLREDYKLDPNRTYALRAPGLLLKREIKTLEERVMVLKRSAMSLHCGRAHRNRLIGEIAGLENLIKLKQISYNKL